MVAPDNAGATVVVGPAGRTVVDEVFDAPGPAVVVLDDGGVELDGAASVVLVDAVVVVVACRALDEREPPPPQATDVARSAAIPATRNRATPA
jgi:hypothetical protein